MLKRTLMLTATVGLLSACTTTGNVERNAAIGAAGGAIAGAIIGNNTGSGDAETGAAIGAVVGAAGGAYVGHEKDKRQVGDTRLKDDADGEALIYDASADRYYFVDQTTGRTYWQDGSVRTY